MNLDRKPILSGQSPFAMIIFSALGVIIVGLVFQLLGVFLATLFYDVSVFELLQTDGLDDRGAVNGLKVLQIVGAIGTFIVSSLLLSFFYTGRWLGYFPFGRGMSGQAVLLMIVIMMAALPFVNFLTDLNTRFEIPLEGLERYFRQMEEQTEKMMMTLVRADNLGALFVNLFMIAIIPAVGEELVFRGLIQRHLTDLFRNPHVAIVIASVIFSVVHFQIYSFLPRFFLGLILGYAFYYGKTLWYPMLAHLVNNGVAVIFYYLYFNGRAGDSLEEIGTMEVLPVAAAISILLVAGLMFLWIKMVREKRAANES
jgi:membrane protease YdiL (CAAX protease family)